MSQMGSFKAQRDQILQKTQRLEKKGGGPYPINHLINHLMTFWIHSDPFVELKCRNV